VLENQSINQSMYTYVQEVSRKWLEKEMGFQSPAQCRWLSRCQVGR